MAKYIYDISQLELVNNPKANNFKPEDSELITSYEIFHVKAKNKEKKVLV